MAVQTGLKVIRHLHVVTNVTDCRIKPVIRRNVYRLNNCLHRIILREHRCGNQLGVTVGNLVFVIQRKRHQTNLISAIARLRCRHMIDNSSQSAVLVTSYNSIDTWDLEQLVPLVFTRQTFQRFTSLQIFSKTAVISQYQYIHLWTQFVSITCCDFDRISKC